MEAIEALRSRYSVREFTARQVPKRDLETIVDCGRLAPTARKEEPWEFVVVTEPGRLKALADLTDHGKFIASATAAVVVICRDTKYYLEDGCAATENMLVAAASLGIGSCWVAGDKKPYCQQALEFVKAPAGYKLVSIIALGYPAKDQKPLEKKPLRDLLYWDRF